STECKKSQELNKIYKNQVRKSAPSFYKKYTGKRSYESTIIVDLENDLYDKRGKSVWPEKDGHDYAIITRKRIEGKYLMISWLTKKAYPRGTRIKAKLTLCCDYATVKPIKREGFSEDFHHERSFIDPSMLEK
ncbi:hypothetical protein D6825_00015, partial [Candidatus Woesearchaeota archaeon]